MKGKNLQYVYGPVSSWRLGSSLGVDLLGGKEKKCNFDCPYCQLGRTRKYTNKRDLFVPTENVLEEIFSLFPLEVDYITFSGRGEPTLAKNLGEVIAKLKENLAQKVAVITNSSLLSQTDVQRDLMQADFVLAKLDAASQHSFININHPKSRVRLKKILRGIKAFRNIYRGKLALQIMFTDENAHEAPSIAQASHEIDPDEIQINTPLRQGQANPLLKVQLRNIKNYFPDPITRIVYENTRTEDNPFDQRETYRRRGIKRKVIH